MEGQLSWWRSWWWQQQTKRVLDAFDDDVKRGDNASKNAYEENGGDNKLETCCEAKGGDNEPGNGYGLKGG